MSASSTSRGGADTPGSRSSGGRHGMPSARKTPSSSGALRERPQGVHPRGGARALEERGAEPLRRGDHELDRDALDREAHDTTFVGGQQRHDLRQLDEAREHRSRVGRGTHDREVLAVVPPAPRIPGHGPAECVRDRARRVRGRG